MCKNVVEKGNLDKPVIIFNRTLKRALDFQKTFPSGKSIVAATVEELVPKSDIIFISVGDDLAINETVDNILKSNAKGKVIVDTSTVHPDTTDALAKRVADSGAEFVACPVFGAPAIANSGQLICVLAGSKTATEKVKPYLQGVMGRAVIDYAGQPCGTATTLKIVGNTLILNMVESIAEGHVLAEKAGLGTDNLHKLIELMFPVPYTAYSTRMLSGDYYKRDEPLAPIDLLQKDARHALTLAKSFGTQLEALEVVEAHITAVKDHMGPKGDLAGIYGAVRKESGLKFEN
jgi:3-hydroxyisobutyrate dehydrogenase-like beta-hydroxyacid dehydrogenase